MAQIILATGNAPSTPATNKVAMYAKTDGLIYSKNEAGVEFLVTSVIVKSTAIVSDTATTTIYSVSASEYRSLELNIQATQGTSYYLAKFLVLHDGTDAHITQFSTVNPSTLDIVISADVSGGNLIIQTTQGVATSTTYKINALPNIV